MIYLDQMMRSLEKVAELEGFAGAMVQPAQKASDVLLIKAMQLQPHGYSEPWYGAPTSARLGHTAIRDGWRPELETEDKGVKIRIGNISEHVKYIILGTRSRPIRHRGGKFLFFWWGPGVGSSHPMYGLDKKWGPEYHPEHTGAKPGMRRFIWVDHPGTLPDPFVEKAKDDTKEEMTDYIRAGVENYLREAMKP